VNGFFDLTGRVAAVTGANTGIGQGIAIALAKAGADVALIGRTPAEETAEEVRAVGRRPAILSADLSSMAPISEIVDQTVAELGGLDILVNNAGIIRHLVRRQLSRPAMEEAELRSQADPFGTR
jgi:2-deoxy-D-gluconate 3-dehydrogenase